MTDLSSALQLAAPELTLAVGGLVHETNTFAPGPTTLADFDSHGSSLPILRGQALVAANRRSQKVLRTLGKPLKAAAEREREKV